MVELPIEYARSGGSCRPRIPVLANFFASATASGEARCVSRSSVFAWFLTCVVSTTGGLYVAWYWDFFLLEVGAATLGSSPDNNGCVFGFRVDNNGRVLFDSFFESEAFSDFADFIDFGAFFDI
jgi:hypothetical protein